MVFEQWDERGKLNCIIRKWELFDAKDLTIAALRNKTKPIYLK